MLSSDLASVENPVLVFLVGVNPNLLKRISCSCFGELILNSEPENS